MSSSCRGSFKRKAVGVSNTFPPGTTLPIYRKPHVNGPKLGFLQDSPETNPMQYKSLRIIIPGIQRGNPSLSQSIQSQKLGIWHFSHAAQTPTRRQEPQALQNHKHWRPKRNQTNLILDQLWNPHLHLNDSSEISKN